MQITPVPQLSLSRRVRKTPFSERVTEAGVKAYTSYNHMRLPTVFESVEADYHHLKRHVQVWDVSCERQVAVRGKDADRLVQLLSPRDLRKMADDQCFYLPMIDARGGMINDPVLLRIAPQHYWISIADSDVLLWVKGIAAGMGLEVDVEEPDVSPLAVQGPKADALMARVFGEGVKKLRFFRHRRFAFRGHDFVVARSGYSKQGGFEIYVDDAALAEPLWDALFAAGEDLQVRAGCPNLIERVESGLLSYGNDMTLNNTPFEAGLGKYCNAPDSVDYIGKAALAAVREPRQQIRGLLIEGEALPACVEVWPLTADGQPIGQVTSACWSPDIGSAIGIGMVASSHWQPGTPLQLTTPAGERVATVTTLPFDVPGGQ